MFETIFFQRVRFCLVLCIVTSGIPAIGADESFANVRQIFQTRCSECHAVNSTNASARDAWAGVERFQELRDNDYIPAENVAEADLPDVYLWDVLAVSKSMPPRRAKAGSLTNDELENVKNWLTDGATFLKPAAQRKLISQHDILRIVANDLQAQPENQRHDIRYLTLASLHNQARLQDSDLDVARQAMTKLINSLSWNREFVRLTPVDKDRVVYRFHLRELHGIDGRPWPAGRWDRLVDVYPYAILPDARIGASLKALTGTELPYLRLDWFVFAATQPPLYHELLELPRKLDDLERTLRVSRKENTRAGDVVRAGFTDSGVSTNNRLIERHGFRDGAFWLSYDFSGNLERNLLRDNPLGPADAFPAAKNVFQHAGGELIFNLPNGLQAYLLIDNKGDRIDVGPSDIVYDQSLRGGFIINGISCMSCHDQGMKTASDELRDQHGQEPFPIRAPGFRSAAKNARAAEETQRTAHPRRQTLSGRRRWRGPCRRFAGHVQERTRAICL
jgi:hypothetical protein